MKYESMSICIQIKFRPSPPKKMGRRPWHTEMPFGKDTRAMPSKIHQKKSSSFFAEKIHLEVETPVKICIANRGQIITESGKATAYTNSVRTKYDFLFPTLHVCRDAA